MSDDMSKSKEIGMDEAVVNWTQDRFKNLLKKFHIYSDWEPEMSAKGKRALDAPSEKSACMKRFSNLQVLGFRPLVS